MALTRQEPNLARARNLHLWILLLMALESMLLCGCAAPGVPVTRETTKPQAITNLSAKQVGASIVLSFALPTETVKGGALSMNLKIEIYRVFESVSGAKSRHGEKLRLITTIPAQMVDQYLQAGQIDFPDMLTPQDLTAHAGKDEAVYEVRTRGARSESDPSNAIQIPILPAPQPIHDLRAQIANDTVELSWSAPAIVPSGVSEPVSTRYQVYRAELPDVNSASSSAEPLAASASPGAASAGFALLGESSEPSYSDTKVEAGQSYRYKVRSIAKYMAGSVESEDSNVIEVKLAANHRPVAPKNVVAAVVRAHGTASPSVELSWEISPETDLAGYNVYRSNKENETGTRVNTVPVLVPVFRDTSVTPGVEYFYRITAVGRGGNESEPSAPVAVTVPISK
jgi:Fibronectin type III domain